MRISGTEKELCRKRFYELCEELKETHELVKSCNRDDSMYLIPKGTKKQLSYYGKPINSYRYSDHWNWYANVKKCKLERHIQCYNVDLPRAKNRPKEGKASEPIFAACIAYFDTDRRYHTIFHADLT